MKGIIVFLVLILATSAIIAGCVGSSQPSTTTSSTTTIGSCDITDFGNGVMKFQCSTLDPNGFGNALSAYRSKFPAVEIATISTDANFKTIYWVVVR